MAARQAAACPYCTALGPHAGQWVFTVPGTLAQDDVLTAWRVTNLVQRMLRADASYRWLAGDQAFAAASVNQASYLNDSETRAR